MSDGIENYRLTLNGTTPLILNNIMLADPEYPATAERNKILSSNRSKDRTKNQQDHLEYLEWFGSLYLDEQENIVFPAYNIIRSLQRAATPFRLGVKITNGVSIAGQQLPLTHAKSGVKPIELYQDSTYKFRKMVNKTPTGGKASMVVCVRPKFDPWSVTANVSVLTDVINSDDFFKVLGVAGRGQGLGNARRLGFGQFDYVVNK